MNRAGSGLPGSPSRSTSGPSALASIRWSSRDARSMRAQFLLEDATAVLAFAGRKFCRSCLAPGEGSIPPPISLPKKPAFRSPSVSAPLEARHFRKAYAPRLQKAADAVLPRSAVQYIGKIIGNVVELLERRALPIRPAPQENRTPPSMPQHGPAPRLVSTPSRPKIAASKSSA